MAFVAVRSIAPVNIALSSATVSFSIVMPIVIQLALNFGIPVSPSIWRGTAERKRHTALSSFAKSI